VSCPSCNVALLILARVGCESFIAILISFFRNIVVIPTRTHTHNPIQLRALKKISPHNPVNIGLNLTKAFNCTVFVSAQLSLSRSTFVSLRSLPYGENDVAVIIILAECVIIIYVAHNKSRLERERERH
jgi:hypothetical protein